MLDTLAKSIVSLSSPSPLSNQDQSITAHSKKCRQSVATQQLNRKGAKRRGAHKGGEHTGTCQMLGKRGKHTVS